MASFWSWWKGQDNWYQLTSETTNQIYARPIIRDLTQVNVQVRNRLLNKGYCFPNRTRLVTGIGRVMTHFFGKMKSKCAIMKSDAKYRFYDAPHPPNTPFPFSRN